jgi:hypothetical protein
MKRVDTFLAVLAGLMGVCCLLVVATAFSVASFIPAGLREFLLTWGPLLCVLGVTTLGLTLYLPGERVQYHMSKRLVTLLTIAGTVVAVGAVALGLSTITRPAPTTSAPLTSSVAAASPEAQMSDAGGLQVEVKFNRTASTKGSLEFDVGMNTHSVELGQFDLTKLSQVVLVPGGTISDFTWQPAGPGSGHHVEGKLTARDPKGLLSAAKSITLEIKGLASQDVRRFQWKGSQQ